jgi:hypothetical protein
MTAIGYLVVAGLAAAVFTDPRTFAAASAILIGVALLASTSLHDGRRESVPWWRCGTNSAVMSDEW